MTNGNATIVKRQLRGDNGDARLDHELAEKDVPLVCDDGGDRLASSICSSIIISSYQAPDQASRCQRNTTERITAAAVQTDEQWIREKKTARIQKQFPALDKASRPN